MNNSDGGLGADHGERVIESLKGRRLVLLSCRSTTRFDERQGEQRRMRMRNEVWLIAVDAQGGVEWSGVE